MLVIIPVIIRHPYCTLWLLFCSCFELQPGYLCEWKTGTLKIRDNKRAQDVFKAEDAIPVKNDLAPFYFSVKTPPVALE